MQSPLLGIWVLEEISLKVKSIDGQTLQKKLKGKSSGMEGIFCDGMQIRDPSGRFTVNSAFVALTTPPRLNSATANLIWNFKARRRLNSSFGPSSIGG